MVCVGHPSANHCSSPTKAAARRTALDIRMTRLPLRDTPTHTGNSRHIPQRLIPARNTLPQVYTDIDIAMHLSICLCIYIYIYKERERERVSGGGVARGARTEEDRIPPTPPLSEEQRTTCPLNWSGVTGLRVAAYVVGVFVHGRAPNAHRSLSLASSLSLLRTRCGWRAEG